MNCATCKYWRPVGPRTSDDGECSGVGASYYMQDKTIVLAGNILTGGDEGPRLITDAKFGCVRWEA